MTCDTATSVTTVRVHVAFTPAEEAAAPVGIVVDVLRATSTIAQALASGYRRVLCCAEVEQARALRSSIPDSLVGGERNAVRIEGFDAGASPREFLEPRADTLILSTTNGTQAILAAAARSDEVLLGSLLNLDAVVAQARALGGDVALLCAGFKGAFALDDAYCAGRIVSVLGGEHMDSAVAAGNQSVKIDPAPTALRTLRSPPMSRASRRLIVRPKPEPSVERVWPVSTCTNGSKMTGKCSGGMPMPVSRTWKYTHFGHSGKRASTSGSFVVPHSSATCPPRSVNFTALDRRLMRICRTRSSSPT